MTSRVRDQPTRKRSKVGGPHWVAGRPPWSADGPVGPTTFRLHEALPGWLLKSVQEGITADEAPLGRGSLL